eukprot:TRINITY_DN14271_c0_g1_i1.p1 TRINITY_DN14271_c0_g1~~TRINITY_DN14271_c0_g1_i1.p1  ORF type:complete len:913 (+),score=178.94 TRINITY_DN14271_c0_g1_i1:65-2740(+)
MTALWVPKGATFRDNSEWVDENFPKQLRLSQVIFKADNILDPKVLHEMFKFRRKVENIDHNGLKWKDVCLKIPVVKKPKCFDPSKFSLFDYFFGKRRKRNTEEEDDECSGIKLPDLSAFSFAELAEIKLRMETEGFTPELADDVSRKFYPQPYCDFIKNAPTVCAEESILELWAFDGIFEEEVFKDLTESDILDAVNNRNKSGLLMIEKNFKNLLGEVSYNSSGHIVGAKVSSMTWIGKVNLTALNLFGSVQRGEMVDKYTYDFEGEMMKVTTDRSEADEGVETFVIIARMFFEALQNQAFKDAGMLLVGYMIVFIYVILMIGRFNFVQQRFFLSFGGMLGVIMGIVVCYGICSVLGFFYSPAHTVMPFLLLGIGIDDMFVIVQCRSTLTAKEKSKPVVDRMGATMSHAGVAITITSITDFIAFGIGATTVLPALRSFCMYAAIGIMVIFFFQSTWFTALLAIDEYRVDAHRDGCLCCVVHNDFSIKQDESQGILAKIFEIYSNLLVTIPFKISTIIFTISLLGVGIFGIIHLRMEFRPEWLMDPDSEIHGWYEAHKKYFALDGERGTIYIKETNYTDNFDKLEELVTKLENEELIIRSIDSWFMQFKKFLSMDDPNFEWNMLNETMFQEKLSHFLFAPMGAKYRLMLKFDGDLQCGQPAPPIVVSSMDFVHIGFDSATEWVPALDKIYSLVENSNITQLNTDDQTTAVFPMAVRYANWVTDKVIQRELYQNIGSSMIAIFITVLIFLGSFRGACFVIFCVFATIVEVAGFMYFWGLTIDVITCNTLVISIGLCVDFSAHIAHGFISRSGTRNERMVQTMTKIGPAVLNGGLSTLFAFILLSTSKTYIFLSFFKIFFLICVFGLFHGLVALPVLLALIGPESQVKMRKVCF